MLVFQENLRGRDKSLRVLILLWSSTPIGIKPVFKNPKNMWLNPGKTGVPLDNNPPFPRFGTPAWSPVISPSASWGWSRRTRVRGAPSAWCLPRQSLELLSIAGNLDEVWTQNSGPAGDSLPSTPSFNDRTLFSRTFINRNFHISISILSVTNSQCFLYGSLQPRLIKLLHSYEWENEL